MNPTPDPVEDPIEDLLKKMREQPHPSLLWTQAYGAIRQLHDENAKLRKELAEAKAKIEELEEYMRGMQSL